MLKLVELSELQMINDFWIVSMIGSVNCHLDRIRIIWEMIFGHTSWGDLDYIN